VFPPKCANVLHGEAWLLLYVGQVVPECRPRMQTDHPWKGVRIWLGGHQATKHSTLHCAQGILVSWMVGSLYAPLKVVSGVCSSVLLCVFFVCSPS
jgi:hypothetical protein